MIYFLNKSIQTGNPKRLEIMLTMPGNLETESWFHNRFLQYKIDREWFRYSHEIKSFVEPKNKPDMLSRFLESILISVINLSLFLLAIIGIYYLISSFYHPLVLVFALLGLLALRLTLDEYKFRIYMPDVFATEKDNSTPLYSWKTLSLLEKMLIRLQGVAYIFLCEISRYLSFFEIHIDPGIVAHEDVCYLKYPNRTWEMEQFNQDNQIHDLGDP